MSSERASFASARAPPWTSSSLSTLCSESASEPLHFVESDEAAAEWVYEDWRSDSSNTSMDVRGVIMITGMCRVVAL